MPAEVWHKLENISGHELDRNNAGLYFPKKKVISISSQKGGVGKTSLVAIIASIFANMGYRVLVIDMDPQGNLTEQYYREDQDFPSEILADPDGDEFSPGLLTSGTCSRAMLQLTPYRLATTFIW
jgi:chromosome partitioning protein